MARHGTKPVGRNLRELGTVFGLMSKLISSADPHEHFCSRQSPRMRLVVFLVLSATAVSGCHQSAAQKQEKKQYEQNATAGKATIIKQGGDKVKNGD